MIISVSRTVIDREKVVESVNHLVDMSARSATTKEIFIVASETDWLRLYWNPIVKDWIVTLFPGGDLTNLTSEKVKGMIKSLSQKYSKIRGFQYRTSPVNLDIYFSR